MLDFLSSSLRNFFLGFRCFDWVWESLPLLFPFIAARFWSPQQTQSSGVKNLRKFPSRLGRPTPDLRPASNPSSTDIPHPWLRLQNSPSGVSNLKDSAPRVGTPISRSRHPRNWPSAYRPPTANLKTLTLVHRKRRGKKRDVSPVLALALGHSHWHWQSLWYWHWYWHWPWQ